MYVQNGHLDQGYQNKTKTGSQITIQEIYYKNHKYLTLTLDFNV